MGLRSFNNVPAGIQLERSPTSSVLRRELLVDILYAQQTVYETLLMAALLRLPKEVSRAAKEQVVRTT